MKKFKVTWDESIIYHMEDVIEASSKKEAIQLVKDMKVHGFKQKNTPEDFDRIIHRSITAQPIIDHED